jgi:MFS family permease
MRRSRLERGADGALGGEHMWPGEKANAARCTLAHVVFGFGTGMIEALTVLPLLLERLGASKLVLGLAWGLATAGWLLLEPLAAFVFGRRPRSKRFLVPWGILFTVPFFLGMGLAIRFVGPVRPALCIVLVLVLFGIRVLGEGMTFPLWDDWFARLFSKDFRGRALGLVFGFMGLGMSIGALTAGAVRRNVEFPLGFALLYWGAGAVFGVGYLLILWMREPEGWDATTREHTVRELAGCFMQSLGDHNFRSYLIARIILTLAGGTVGFYATHFRSAEGGGVGEATIISLGLFLTLPQCVTAYLIGRLGDSVGHKTGVVLGTLAFGASIAVVWLGQGAAACGLAFLLLGIGNSAGAAHLNLLYETCPHDSRVAHITVANIVLSPFLILVPVGTGWVMERLGVVTFGLALLPGAVGLFWLLLAVKEPRTISLEDVPVGEDGGQAPPAAS